MRNACNVLYNIREHSLSRITEVEILINSIANRPKEFDKQIGETKHHILKFHQTKKYVNQARKEAIKCGFNILSGAAAGEAIAAATPIAAMSIATTF